MISPPDTSQAKLPSSTQRPNFINRVVYRVRQFRLALNTRTNEEQQKRAGAFLNSSEFQLFCQMQPSEQSHSLKVLDKLLDQGFEDPSLLAAALLHDAGKSRHPLAVWERVMIVLGRALFPAKARDWGQGRIDTGKLKNVFVVAEQHAEWGAALAEKAGSSPMVVNLIRRHQDILPPIIENTEDRLLATLQAADDVL